MYRISGLMLSALALVLLISARAQSSESACAVVLYVSDGFVAVRQGPSAATAMIEKIFPGQVVGVTASAATPGWVRLDVMFKPGLGKLLPLKEMDGWVNGNLVRPIDCG
jgi:hypothetical protein